MSARPVEASMTVTAQEVWKERLRRGRVWLVLVLLALVGAAASGGIFLKPDNLLNVLLIAAPIGVAALGQSVVILTAGIDLSVASTWALASVVGATLAANGSPWSIAVGGALLAGLVVGIANGVVIGYLKVPPLITTLGMLAVAEGAARLYSADTTVYSLPTSFTTIGNGQFGPIPLQLLLWAVAVVGMLVLMDRTAFGKYVYAIGGNATVAEMSGAPVPLVLTGVYALSGLMAGLAAVIETAYLNIAVPNNDLNMLFDIIAAAVIGGVSLFGGIGRITDAMAGVLIIVVVQNVLNIVGVSPLIESGVLGVIIFLAVLLNVVQSRDRDRPEGRGV